MLTWGYPGYPLKPASPNKCKIQTDAWISVFFAHCYLQHFQMLCCAGWWARDLMPCSVWCLYEKCSIVSTGYSFWWELAGIICANDSLSILQDEEHVFPLLSPGFSGLEGMALYTKLPLKLEETGIGPWWVGDEEEKDKTVRGFEIGLDRITCVVLQA